MLFGRQEIGVWADWASVHIPAVSIVNPLHKILCRWAVKGNGSGELSKRLRRGTTRHSHAWGKVRLGKRRRIIGLIHRVKLRPWEGISGLPIPPSSFPGNRTSRRVYGLVVWHSEDRLLTVGWWGNSLIVDDI